MKPKKWWRCTLFPQFCCGHLTVTQDILKDPEIFGPCSENHVKIENRKYLTFSRKLHSGHTPGQSRQHVEATGDSSKMPVCKKENQKIMEPTESLWNPKISYYLEKSKRIHSICGYINLECFQPWSAHGPSLFSQALAGETASVPVPAANLASVSLAMARMRCCWSSWQDCSWKVS